MACILLDERFNQIKVFNTLKELINHVEGKPNGSVFYSGSPSFERISVLSKLSIINHKLCIESSV